MKIFCLLLMALPLKLWSADAVGSMSVDDFLHAFSRQEERAQTLRNLDSSLRYYKNTTQGQKNIPHPLEHLSVIEALLEFSMGESVFAGGLREQRHSVLYGQKNKAMVLAMGLIQRMRPAASVWVPPVDRLLENYRRERCYYSLEESNSNLQNFMPNRLSRDEDSDHPRLEFLNTHLNLALFLEEITPHTTSLSSWRDPLLAIVRMHCPLEGLAFDELIFLLNTRLISYQEALTFLPCLSSAYRSALYQTMSKLGHDQFYDEYFAQMEAYVQGQEHSVMILESARNAFSSNMLFQDRILNMVQRHILNDSYHPTNLARILPYLFIHAKNGPYYRRWAESLTQATPAKLVNVSLLMQRISQQWGNPDYLMEFLLRTLELPHIKGSLTAAEADEVAQRLQGQCDLISVRYAHLNMDKLRDEVIAYLVRPTVISSVRGAQDATRNQHGQQQDQDIRGQEQNDRVSRPQGQMAAHPESFPLSLEELKNKTQAFAQALGLQELPPRPRSRNGQIITSKSTQLFFLESQFLQCYWRRWQRVQALSDPSPQQLRQLIAEDWSYSFLAQLEAFLATPEAYANPHWAQSWASNLLGIEIQSFDSKAAYANPEELIEGGRQLRNLFLSSSP